MLGLNGKESERDDRFSAALPLDVEKVDTQKSSNPAQRKKSLITRSFERHRRLPLLSRIISILASIWIIFASMCFIVPLNISLFCRDGFSQAFYGFLAAFEAEKDSGNQQLEGGACAIEFVIHIDLPIVRELRF